jgi:hypothetical protein
MCIAGTLTVLHVGGEAGLAGLWQYEYALVLLAAAVSDVYFLLFWAVREFTVVPEVLKETIIAFSARLLRHYGVPELGGGVNLYQQPPACPRITKKWQTNQFCAAGRQRGRIRCHHGENH